MKAEIRTIPLQTDDENVKRRNERDHVRVLAIRTDFQHHGENHGYKQILKRIKPQVTLGIDERSSAEQKNVLFRKYQWLFEFKALRYISQIDVVHILYGEDYFRFSGRLFKSKPLVVTFHQPAEILEQEVLHGNIRGKVGRLTHLMNKNRFEAIDAAIVTNPAQKEVLRSVMPGDRIHVIPLGIDVSSLNKLYRKHQPKAFNGQTVITVGNWLRDWDFYFKVVKACPHVTFHLVNRKLDAKFRKKTRSFQNLHFHDNVTDQELATLTLQCDIQFVPIKGLAGSNALIHGFALGCPLLVTGLDQEDLYGSNNEFVWRYEKDNLHHCVEQLNQLLNLHPEQLKSLQDKAFEYAQRFSWDHVAGLHMELYKSLLK